MSLQLGSRRPTRSRHLSLSLSSRDAILNTLDLINETIRSGPASRFVPSVEFKSLKVPRVSIHKAIKEPLESARFINRWLPLARSSPILLHWNWSFNPSMSVARNSRWTGHVRRAYARFYVRRRHMYAFMHTSLAISPSLSFSLRAWMQMRHAWPQLGASVILL